MMPAVSRTKTKGKKPAATVAKVKKPTTTAAKAKSGAKGKKPAATAAKAKKPVARGAKAGGTATKKTPVAKTTRNSNTSMKKPVKLVKKTPVIQSEPAHTSDTSNKAAMRKVEASVERATVKAAKLTNDLVEMRVKRSAARRKAASSATASAQNALNSVIARVGTIRLKLNDAKEILSQEKKQLVAIKARDRLQTRLDGLDARTAKQEATYATNIEKRLEAAVAKFRDKRCVEMEKVVVKKMKTFARVISKKKVAVEAAYERSQRRRAKKLLKTTSKGTD